MAFYSYQNVCPVIDPRAYIHADATIIGEVVVGADCFIGAQAVLRGDFGRIEVHATANIQETCVVHSFPNKSVHIGKAAHVGHGAILHGCYLDENCLIGMNAVIMDDVRIGRNTIIGALSFVGEGREFKDNVLVYGNPAREIRSLSEKEVEWKTNGTNLYQELAMARETQPCEPKFNENPAFDTAKSSSPKHNQKQNSDYRPRHESKT